MVTFRLPITRYNNPMSTIIHQQEISYNYDPDEPFQKSRKDRITYSVPLYLMFYSLLNKEKSHILTILSHIVFCNMEGWLVCVFVLSGPLAV